MSKLSGFFSFKFFRDRLVLVSFLLAFLVNIILWIWLAIKFGYSHERIPLHFSIVYGIDFVGESRRIYQIPIFGLVVLVVNTILGRMVYEREKLFGYFLLFGAAVVQVILAIAVWALLSL